MRALVLAAIAAVCIALIAQAADPVRFRCPPGYHRAPSGVCVLTRAHGPRRAPRARAPVPE